MLFRSNPKLWGVCVLLIFSFPNLYAHDPWASSQGGGVTEEGAGGGGADRRPHMLSLPNALTELLGSHEKNADTNNPSPGSRGGPDDGRHRKQRRSVAAGGLSPPTQPEHKSTPRRKCWPEVVEGSRSPYASYLLFSLSLSLSLDRKSTRLNSSH